MTTAVTPFAEWLHGAAESAAQIAGHARTAAAAYALAFAMTVPPPVIAANRSLLLALVATNFFGQNSAAIAAAETHYAQMWSQDATAMYLYADSSATASVLPPVKQPPQSPLSSPVVQILEHVPNVTNSVLSSANAVTSGRGIWAVNMRLAAQEVAEPGPSFPGGARLVSAAVRRGISVGTLSAPPSWGAAAPEMRSPAMPLSGPAAAASAETAGCGSVFGQSALGTLSRSEPRPARHKSKPIIVRSPAAG